MISSPNHNMFPWQAGMTGNINSPQRVRWYLLIAVSAALTDTPVLVIDEVYDVRHWLAFDWWLLLEINVVVLFVILKHHCKVMLPLRPDWSTAPPVSLIWGCVRNYNILKWPQQNPRSSSYRSPLQSANMVTETQPVFKVTVFCLEWRAARTESCSHSKGSRAIEWRCTGVKLVFCFLVTPRSYKSIKLLTRMLSKDDKLFTSHKSN